jgi:hypothetical protein
MISFDVVSLFTSIPLDTAKQITRKLLTNNTSWQSHTQLNTQDILDLLDICLSTEFCFQNNYYRQISGTPMGSPLSSFLAEAVMEDLENKAVTNNNDIKTWDRYVDDVFATVKKDKTDDILQTINNTTKNIKFTKEEEHDNKLAFLDVLITRTDNGTLNTQVYRKKTHTDQILNYNRNHPTQNKTSCIKTLFNRIDTHCSTEESKRDERKYLYSTFHKNSLDFVNKVLSHRKQTNTDQPNQTRKRITLPYITMIAITGTPWQPKTIHQPKSVINQSDVPKGFKNENSAKIQTFQLSDEGSKYRVESSKHINYNPENKNICRIIQLIKYVSPS